MKKIINSNFNIKQEINVDYWNENIKNTELIRTLLNDKVSVNKAIKKIAKYKNLELKEVKDNV